MRNGEPLLSIARAAGLATIALGGMVLIGWLFSLEMLKSVFPGMVTMKPNTAVAFVLAGSSLLLQCGDVDRRRGARVCALAVAAIGGVTLFEYVFGVGSGIDQLLFMDSPDAIATSNPGRMAPASALSFMLIGAALLPELRHGRGALLSHNLLLPVTLAATVVLIGYLYRVEPSVRVADFTAMAVHTALGLLMLCVGIVMLPPASGIIAVLARDGSASFVAWRLLPPTLALPVAIGWLRLTAEQAGWFSVAFGTVLVAVLYMTIGCALVCLVAALLHTRDEEKRRSVVALRESEERFRGLNAALELRVHDRTCALEDANAALQRRTLELQSANEELESFAYSVSHDLRAPLRAVDGFSRIVLSDYGPRLDDEGRRLLGILCDESKRMGALIDDLLAFSRMGRQEMKSERVDMAGMALSALEATDPRMRGRVSVKIGALPPAYGDASMLRQVWANLLGNAVKFTSNRDTPVIEVGGAAAEGMITYYVRDNGIGFDPRYAHKLFEVFQRLHAEGEFEGTGVGLAIVQRIIRRHGGNAWAEGESDRGATFYFSLPCAPGS